MSAGKQLPSVPALPMPPLTTITNTADQVRSMGLRIGDTIVGRESHGGGFWEESRLTLLWVGESVAVFREQSRTSEDPAWDDEGETVDWDLGYRQWTRVELEGGA